MKNFILHVLFLVICLGATAQQLPNSDFESWITVESQLDPEGYYTSDSLNFIDNGGNENINQSTDAYGGQFSVRLRTYEYTASFHPASMLLGNSVLSAVPFNGEPVKLRGWSKAELGGESATLNFSTIYMDGVNPIQTATLFHPFNGNYEWTMFEDTIIYLDLQNTDFVTLDITTAGIDTGSIYFDDFELVYGVTSVDELNLSEYTKLYPNPTSGVATLVSNLPKNYQVSITDITGKIIYQVVMQNEKIQLPKLNAGIYGIAIMNPNGKVVYRDKLITQ